MTDTKQTSEWKIERISDGLILAQGLGDYIPCNPDILENNIDPVYIVWVDEGKEISRYEYASKLAKIIQGQL